MEILPWVFLLSQKVGCSRFYRPIATYLELDHNSTTRKENETITYTMGLDRISSFELII